MERDEALNSELRVNNINMGVVIHRTLVPSSYLFDLEREEMPEEIRCERTEARGVLWGHPSYNSLFDFTSVQSPLDLKSTKYSFITTGCESGTLTNT